MNENKDVQMNELLNAAYKSEEPSQAFEDRMTNLERYHRVAGREKPRFTMRRLVVAFGTMSMAVMAVAAWQYFANRPGEAAITYIPSDADVVVTVDLTPSPEQAATFAKIYTAIKREGLDSRFDQLATSALDSSPIAKQIRPHVSNNLAFALWHEAGAKGVNDESAVLFLSLKDVSTVRRSLKSNSKELEHDLFQLTDGKTYAALLDKYLLMSQKPALFNKIRATKDRRSQSVAHLPEYQAARAALPADANLMVFLSPTALAEMNDSAKKQGISALNSARWLAFGGAVRDDGLEFNYRMPLDSSAQPELKGIAGVKPLSSDIYRHLPDGAYGVFAYSQPGRYWSWMTGQGKHEGSEHANFRKDALDFEKQTGISVATEVLPALDGEVVLAVYPGSRGANDFDGLAYVNDANGADPATLANKLRAFAEKQSKKSNEPLSFKQTQRSGAIVWTLERPAKQLSKDFTPSDASMHQDLPGQKAKRPNTDLNPMASKDLIYALVGKQVYVASSHAMINKVLHANTGGRTLADDPAFATMAAKVMPEAEGTLMVSLYRIMQVVKPMFEQNLKGAPVKAGDLLLMFGGESAGLVGSGKYDGQIATGTLFLPLDWQRSIHMLGRGTDVTGMAFDAMEGGLDMKDVMSELEEEHHDEP